MKTLDTSNWDKFLNGSIVKNEKNLLKFKESLDAIGQGFCLAKFTQVTMHLGTGLVHSCHHPKAHKIPLEGLSENPSKLFNTSILKAARHEMLSNKKPSECDYCWRIEQTGNLSDRVYKSFEEWAFKKYNDIVNSTNNETFKPTYLEVSFGNTCNLNCVYCGPEFSSKWVEDLKQKGPLKVKDHLGNEQWVQGWQDLDSLAIPNRLENPYINAFWKWFPEIYSNLSHYRITGGEPLLNKNTMRSLDYIIENSRHDLELSINTNLSVPEKIWNKFIEKLKVLENKNFKKITIYTSIESWNEQAEYARSGLSVSLLKTRLEKLMQLTNVRCTIMSTFNLLAITSFQKLLEWVFLLKTTYNTANTVRLGIDIPYLRYPNCLDVKFATTDLVNDYIQPCLEFIKANIAIFNHNGFEDYEYQKFNRIVENIKNIYINEEDILSNRSKFYYFVNEIDSRKKTNFQDIFPEMMDFYLLCKTNAESKR